MRDIFLDVHFKMIICKDKRMTTLLEFIYSTVCAWINSFNIIYTIITSFFCWSHYQIRILQDSCGPMRRAFLCSATAEELPGSVRREWGRLLLKFISLLIFAKLTDYLFRMTQCEMYFFFLIKLAQRFIQIVTKTRRKLNKTCTIMAD